MRAVWIGLIFAATAAAQDEALGASVFNKSCAVGYCHGSGGTAGRAPKLTGRNFEHGYVHKVTLDGIPNTGMPGWKDRLNSQELNAVIAWVVKASGGVLDPKIAGAAAAGPPMPADAKRGKDLFFDAVRGEFRCSTCHAVDGMGIAVGPNLLTASNLDPAVIRAGKPATVRQGRTRGGETFAALVVDQKPDSIVLFDLALPLPVLRTFGKGEVTFSSGPSWRHSDAVAKYGDPELAAISAYLQWLANR
ncbi:MAG: c-type cytochrome [Acidobacteria bacterium]|nr:c-type cytochrome [Acidobacteriota bacterium]